jgi:hypothetical protein
LSDTQPAAVTGWVPPQTCAYLFQIEATTRTTNGYSYPIVYATDFQTVTLIKPTVVIRPPVPPIHLPVRPVGLQDLPESGHLAGTKKK